MTLTEFFGECNFLRANHGNSFNKIPIDSYSLITHYGQFNDLYITSTSTFWPCFFPRKILTFSNDKKQTKTYMKNPSCQEGFGDAYGCPFIPRPVMDGRVGPSFWECRKAEIHDQMMKMTLYLQH